MTTIAFTGDIAFSKYFKGYWEKDFMSDEIYNYLNSADHVVANVECPLTATGISSTLEITSPPTIFREISEKDYKRLWPLSAKKFCENFIVGKMFVIPKTKDYNAFKWFNFHRKKSFKSAIETYFGKFLYRFGAWEKGDKDLKTYLEQK